MSTEAATSTRRRRLSPRAPTKYADRTKGARGDYQIVTSRAYRRREAGLGYALIAPALALFAVFSFYPFLRNFYLALYHAGNYPGLPNHYVGLSQMGDVLTSSTFLQSLKTTGIFMAIIVPVGVAAGLVLAILAHQKMRGLAIFRTAFASTVTSSAAVGAAVATLLLDPNFGFLPWLHLSINPSITNNPTWALPTVSLIQAWLFTGVSFIIFMAGLQSLPDEVLEAATVDGASPWRRMTRVTIPLLSSSIYVCIIVAMIGALQGFGQIDTLIGISGSANVHTNVLIYLVYQAVYSVNYGLAACYSIALFALTLILTLVQLRLYQRRQRAVA